PCSSGACSRRRAIRWYARTSCTHARTSGPSDTAGERGFELPLSRGSIWFTYKPIGPSPQPRPRIGGPMPSRTCLSLRPALLLIALAGCQPPPGPQAVELPPIEVPVAAPLERQVVDAEEYTGKVGAVERVNVMARVDG